MTKYIVSIDEHSRRGQLVKQLLSELQSRREMHFVSLKEFEAAEDKILLREIKSGLRSPVITLEEARKALLKLKKKARR